MILVYAHRWETIDDALYREMHARVSPERRRKADRFFQRSDAIRTVCGEFMVRYLFRQVYPGTADDIHFVSNEYGKTSVQGYPEFHYNVSHSGDWVVCAVSDFEVGVDVEKAESADLRVADRFFSKEEIDALYSLPENRRNHFFYELWTAKESYIKCIGTGLSTPLTGFSTLGGRVAENGKVTDFVIRHLDIDDIHPLSTCSVDSSPAKIIRLQF